MNSRSNAKLKLHYRKTLELCIILSLLFCLTGLTASRWIKIDVEELESRQEPLIVEAPPFTHQEKPKPRPSLPSVPVPSEDPLIPADETIASNIGFNYEGIPELPDLPEDNEPFIYFDKKPEPIGGPGVIQERLHYPEMARKIGAEGVSYIKILTSEEGQVLATAVFKSSGYRILDDAAAETLQKIAWKPAMQRDRAVKVWVTIQVKFSLR